MSRQYADEYTWSHPYGENVIAHQDGACSVAIAWNGIDAEMLTPSECEMKWADIYTLIGLLGLNYCAEFHFWREDDALLAAEYLSLNDKIIRGGSLAVPVREAIAEHLTPFGMSNSVAFVLTYIPPKRFAFGAKTKLIQQGEASEDLLKAAKQITSRLPGGRLLTTDQYAQLVQQSFHRASYLRGSKMVLDPRFLMSEQVLREAPRVVDGRISVGGRLTKVLAVEMYPNKPDAAWFAGLASLAIPMHISQILIPIDTKLSLRASERASDLAEGTQGKKGRSEKQKTINDLAGFQQFVSENGDRKSVV